MKVSIIAAIGRNRELGKDNKLLWRIKEDLQRFKNLTAGHPIIMGRKTWDSLPIKPLPERYNIVITRDAGFKINDSRKGKGFVVVSSLEDALRQAEGTPRGTQGDDECFVIGGGQIYKETIEKGLVNKLYLTIIDASADADTFFPDYSDFKKVVFEKSGEYTIACKVQDNLAGETIFSKKIKV